MKTEFRNRAFLPVVLPLAILGFVASLVIGFALILLYNTHEAALVLASVTAGGVLLAVSLASSQDRLGARQRTAVGLAGGLPILVGLIFAVGLVFDIDDADLNINRQPHVVVPADALRITASDSLSFDGVSRMTLPADAEVSVVFENNEANVPHNWAMYPSEEDGQAFADQIAETSDPLPGPHERFVTFTAPAAGEYWFQCDIHLNMNGVVVVEEGAEPSVG